MSYENISNSPGSQYVLIHRPRQQSNQRKEKNGNAENRIE